MSDSTAAASPESTTNETADILRGPRPIAKVLADLRKLIPNRLLKQKPATGGRNAQMLTYCPWYRVQRILNHYTGGCCSYEVRERTVTGQHVLMTVRITIHAEEGEFVRDGTGLERLDVSSYGDPQSNAESMAFTPLRSVSWLRLVSTGGRSLRAGSASL
jgi:hypothetical protein